ncbi:MAG: NAD-dependent epimerase/dehydratase family protein, partial [Pseudomonadota bacterium]
MLITGAGGKLGRLLRAARRALPDLHHDYVFQSRGSGADVQWSPGDSLAPLPRCTAVIALWGATSGDEAALAQNSLLVAQSRDLAQALRATRLMHLSSAAVYGPGQNMNEDHATNPQNNYGKSKLEME